MTLGTCLKKEFYPSNLFVYACFPRELKFIRNIFQKLLDTAQNSFSLNCAFFIIEQQRLYNTYGFEGDPKEMLEDFQSISSRWHDSLLR